MHRFALASFSLLVLVGASPAHFVFFIPDNEAQTVKAIFSDSLKPDERVAIEKIENTKLYALCEDKLKGTQITGSPKWTLDKAGSHYKIDGLPQKGNWTIYGITDFGILQRGDAKPFWLKYYPKTVLGELSKSPTLGERVAVEIVPLFVDGKLVFQALVNGKPAVKTEIAVYVPDEDKPRELTTDEKGLTISFDKLGQYGARFRITEAKPGDDKGKKYEEIRHYATLVVQFAGK